MSLWRIITSLGLLAASAAALAQDYPSKPVRVILPFTAGSAIDVMARLVGQGLAERWRQQVIVDNRPGPAGSVAAHAVAKAPADGYTILVHTTAYATNAALNRALPYDPHTDLLPVAPLGAQPYVLVVRSANGPRSVSEVIASSRAKVGGLAYGSAGTGSGTHFVAEKFRLATGTSGLHVPYKGGPEATGDLLGGRIDYWFPPIAIATVHVREGRLLALGVTSASRSSVLPDVPTLAESGLAGFDSTFWSGVWVPAKTSPGIVQRISADIASVVSLPEMRQAFLKLGVDPLKMTAKEFARFIQREIEEAARIAKATGIPAQ